MMTKIAIKTLSILTSLFAMGLSHAQEVGQVLSRTPVYQQVAVPRQTCTQAPALVPVQPSGIGAVIGAVAGGVLGSQLGGRDSQGLSTMAGVFGGAMLGNQVEGRANTPVPVTTCTTQNIYENRLVGYNVVYEFAGKQYTVQLPQDPGATIPLQVTPVSSIRSEAAHGSVVAAIPAGVIQAPGVVFIPPSPTYFGFPPVSTRIVIGSGWPGVPHHFFWR
jgi:uncharacterized protein YcfJ